jgi:hypothetical protein
MQNTDREICFKTAMWKMKKIWKNDVKMHIKKIGCKDGMVGNG